MRRKKDPRLIDLTKRIEDQVAMTEAIKHTTEPNGHHIIVEHWVRCGLVLMLDSQLRSLREIERLAREISRDDT
jgi:hypothetical protein